MENGKKVGLDSMYSFEWDYDCEQEGKILFKQIQLTSKFKLESIF